MDPKECLKQADQMISDLDYASARMRLSEYWKWRRRGGFEPFEVAGTLDRGDDFARECKRRLDGALGTKPVEFTCHVEEEPTVWHQGGFTSLQSALDWATGEARRIEEHYPLEDGGADYIFCEDTLGNSWNLVEENGLYSWEPADVIEEAYPIEELPRLVH